jgi:hypothetical protein
MMITSESSRRLRPVTPVAFALIRADVYGEYASLRVTADLYGHDNREIIGRIHANLPLDGLARTR